MIDPIFGVGFGIGLGFTAIFLITDSLATGFLTTVLDTGFLAAEKEVVGNSNVNKRAKTMYFFNLSFSRFLLSCSMDAKTRSSRYGY